MLLMLAPRIPKKKRSLDDAHPYQQLLPPSMRGLWGHVPASKRKCP